VAVLFIHDGDDFARYGGLLEILDGLIDSARIPPLVAVLLDPWRRLDEYTASPRHGVHVTDEVLPHLRRRLGVSGPARSRGLVGASLGAVAALATACQYPEAYGRLGLISGTFVRRPGPEWPEEVFAPVFSLIASVASEPRLEGYRIFMSTGRYESLIDHHRHLLPYLRITNNTIRAAETWDGHHWGSWRDRLAEALPFLYPTGDGSTSIP
jgi:enterochelin esterase family protein